MTPREFFPLMPDEVFESWLQPLIQRKGWPFDNVDDNLRDSDWRYILGVRTSLSDWLHAKWVLQEIPVREVNWNKLSLKVVEDIVRNSVGGATTSTANVENTKERFRACATFVEEHGTIPLPIVLLNDSGAFKILDGNHRLAAYIYVLRDQYSHIPAWIAEFRQGCNPKCIPGS